MANLDAEHLAQHERNPEARNDSYERQQIALYSSSTCHPFEKLSAIEDSNSVKEHDQTDEADRAGYRRFRCESSDRQTDEEYGSDSERKPTEIDLTDQIPDTDGKKHGKNRLCADNILYRRKHGTFSQLQQSFIQSVSGRGSPPSEIVRAHD
jgi:hypothetical protein